MRLLPVAIEVERLEIIFDMQRFMGDGEHALHFIAAEIAHLEQRYILFGFIGEMRQQYAVGCFARLAQVKRFSCPVHYLCPRCHSRP